MAFIQHEKDGLVYMSSDIIKAFNVFTTRYGGVSEGIFESLNMGSNIGDPQENVEKNYGRVCNLLGVGINDCCVTKQVHGNIVRVVSQEDKHSVGAVVPYEADGLVTNEWNMPLMCFTADCTPVLMCDRENSVIAAVHCGWRGSCGDIIAVAVNKMLEMGAKTESICVAMGPAIGGCCFETDGDVPEAVDKWLGPESGTYIRRSDGKYLVDIRKANKNRLLSLGVPEKNIDISEECTMCSHEKYWSHRYTHGKRGVQCSAVVLR